MSLGCSMQMGLTTMAVMVALCNVGCLRRVDPPEEGKAGSAQAKSTAALTPSPSAQSTVQGNVQVAMSAGTPQSSKRDVPVTIPAKVASDDPLNGTFTLQEATKGLPPKGKLIADITTEVGKMRCDLFDDKAPRAVANFVGLARGLRPFKDPTTREWVKRPGYDGTMFHRIIKGFMIQGGDPTGTGAGEPGYIFQDEVWPGATHDRRGLLCMANRGPNTNGMQFFILDGAATHLDRSFTIFGKCEPDSVIQAIAATEVKGDRAVKPPKISKVTIRRGK
jgi:peptidyl-prolyl cis-trans isomerase A (cyclophilin A)